MINRKNLKMLKFQMNDQQRNKKPKCENGKYQVARICSAEKCGIKENKIVCGLKQCNCNKKSHRDCYTFINFNYLQNLIDEFQDFSFNNIFKDILTSLQTNARQMCILYNEVVQKLYQTYMMPSPIKQIKIHLNDHGVITKDQSIQLQHFFDKYQRYQIPKIQQIPNYQKNVQTIKLHSKNFQQTFKQYSKNLKQYLFDNEKSSIQFIYKYNNERFIKKQQGQQKFGIKS